MLIYIVVALALLTLVAAALSVRILKQTNAACSSGWDA